MATHHERHSQVFDAATSAAATPLPDSSLPSCGARYCPECGMPAWVEWRDAGHVKLRCFSRHWFLMLDERLG
jgi:hypothetical protein